MLDTVDSIKNKPITMDDEELEEGAVKSDEEGLEEKEDEDESSDELDEEKTGDGVEM